jgi:hypothetical protein
MKADQSPRHDEIRLEGHLDAHGVLHKRRDVGIPLLSITTYDAASLTRSPRTP